MANSLNKELKGKVVLLKKENFREEIKDLRFLCNDGFGCNPDTSGSSIYGVWVVNNNKDRVSGYDVESIIETK